MLFALHMTRFYGALLIASLATLATACGSNNGASHFCGDGIVNGSEQCDDGNTVSGDGCSSTCTTETGKCGDGILDVATETCDDGNTVSGDGCSSTCQIETKCGNGIVESGEACDDGNTASSDGCSSTCQVETGYTCTGTPSMCTMGAATGAGTCATPIALTLTNGTGTATGDTTNSTDQVTGERCDGEPSSGTGNDQIVSFTLAAPSDVNIAVTTDVDAVLRLTSTVCDTTTEIADTVGHDGCADLGIEGDGETLTVQRLAAGTYYVVVDSYDDSESGAWSLTVTTSAPTGACGDGNLDSYEECDDGGMVAGDRCSATCTLESNTTEVEPNDDLAHAQVITPTHHIIRGSISSATDVDIYKFTLTAATAIRFETYDGEDPMSDDLSLAETQLHNIDCIYDQHTLSVFDSNGDLTDDTTALYSDGFSGDYDEVNSVSQCAYIGPTMDDTTAITLPAGTYTLKMEDSYQAREKVYIVDVQFGTTVAP